MTTEPENDNPFMFRRPLVFVDRAVDLEMPACAAENAGTPSNASSEVAGLADGEKAG